MKNEVKFLIALLSLIMVATLCRNFPTEDTFKETKEVEEPGDNTGAGRGNTPTYTIVPPETSGGGELEATFTPMVNLCVASSYVQVQVLVPAVFNALAISVAKSSAV